MRLLKNPFRSTGLPSLAGLAKGEICVDPTNATKLFNRCPLAIQTPLLEVSELAKSLGVASVHLKDERTRMGLGSFKALGAAHAIAKMAADREETGSAATIDKALEGTTFVCASAGNHGLSMAAGAALFGANAVVYLSRSVPGKFAQKLKDKKASVVVEGDNYEASMAAAMAAADQNGWILLSDSSWPGYSDRARDVMEGYLIMGAEVANQINQPPTHIFLQAGVGGLAAAATASARKVWGGGPVVVIVEPEFAPALIESIEAGGPESTEGPVSNMGRLDCKEPSHLALKYLANEADYFMTISENDAQNAVDSLAEHDIETSPSGGAGVAGLVTLSKAGGLPDLNENSQVLAFITEGAEGA